MTPYWIGFLTGFLVGATVMFVAATPMAFKIIQDSKQKKEKPDAAA